MEENKIPENIDDKLSKVKYVCADEPHLKPDPDRCIKCKSKACTFVCPANVYLWDSEEKKLLIRYENCLECGACRVACEKKCIEWKYPKAGYGVGFKYG
jgi:ferredoxin like protein